MENISNVSGVPAASLKVNFGDKGTVLVSGDKFGIDANGNALATNNIKFSFNIKGLDYSLKSGVIDIK